MPSAAGDFDSKITLACDNVPAKVEWAVAVEAMLEKVGFEVPLDNGRDVTDHVVNDYYPGNYDLACSAVSMSNAAPWSSFQAVVLGQDAVTQARVGYKSEAMSTAMAELRVASTQESRQEALQSMQEVQNKQIPTAITGHGERGTAWNDNVTGVRAGLQFDILFDDIRVPN